MKKLSYLFPSGNPSELKIFEDNTSTVRGHYFKRSVYKKLKEYDNTDSSCIYFLLYTDSEDGNHIYIGQSINGFNRIDYHNVYKGNWIEGYLFNSTNGSWNKTIIDYLEYHYIEVFKATEYIVENDAERRKPLVGMYELADINEYIRQLDFLLLANGITHQHKKHATAHSDYIIYENANYNAKLMQRDGIYVLLKDSEIKRPIESSKDWTRDNFYINNNKKIDDLIESDIVIEKDNKLITIDDIEFRKPSPAANLVTGSHNNGWKFWNIDRND